MVESCKGLVHEVVHLGFQVGLQVVQHPQEVGLLEVVLLKWVVQTWAHLRVEVVQAARRVAALLGEGGQAVFEWSNPFCSYHLLRRQKYLNIVLDF